MKRTVIVLTLAVVVLIVIDVVALAAMAARWIAGRGQIELWP